MFLHPSLSKLVARRGWQLVRWCGKLVENDVDGLHVKI
jgi:hypothetical protein